MTKASTGPAGLHIRHARLSASQKTVLQRLSARWVLPRMPTDLSAPFTGKAPIVMEIGAGTGDVSLQLAQRHPENNYLVVEVYRGGVAQLLRRCEQHDLDNVRVVMQDAVFVLSQCPRNSLAEVMIFFPDPWPKKRHHKRRLLQVPFLRDVASKLVPWGRVHIATDDEGYAAHITAAMRQQSDLKLVSGTTIPRPRWRPVTRYEEKARINGSSIYEWLLTSTGPHSSQVYGDDA